MKTNTEITVRTSGRDVLKIIGERVSVIHCKSERAADRVAAHVVRLAITSGLSVSA